MDEVRMESEGLTKQVRTDLADLGSVHHCDSTRVLDLFVAGAVRSHVAGEIAASKAFACDQRA